MHTREVTFLSSGKFFADERLGGARLTSWDGWQGFWIFEFREVGCAQYTVLYLLFSF